jgi:phenylpropionate dioxygenase-like ring-hydroxylating dioxygenase large terminal subunit
MEAKKIFQMTWVFLVHEFEIPWPGDYVLRRIIDDSFIVARDENGQIHVLFNMCRHRGMQLCHADAGNTSHFRCPYHGYTYKNTGKLNGGPFQKEAYGPEGLDKDEWAMTPAPRVGVYEGMIFASLDPDVRPLEEHIGEMGWYLDFYLKDGVQILAGSHGCLFMGFKPGSYFNYPQSIVADDSLSRGVSGGIINSDGGLGSRGFSKIAGLL